MLGIAKWILPPMLAGALIGATLDRGTAHACECSHEFWVVQRVAVGSTQPEVDDGALWPEEGQLSPGRLSLWQPGQSLNVAYRR
jgi:hypothetical protein